MERKMSFSFISFTKLANSYLAVRDLFYFKVFDNQSFIPKGK